MKIEHKHTNRLLQYCFRFAGRCLSSEPLCSKSFSLTFEHVSLSTFPFSCSTNFLFSIFRFCRVAHVFRCVLTTQNFRSKAVIKTEYLRRTFERLRGGLLSANRVKKVLLKSDHLRAPMAQPCLIVAGYLHTNIPRTEQTGLDSIWISFAIFLARRIGRPG